MSHTFHLWAPYPQSVHVVVDGASHLMSPWPEEPGWWYAAVDHAGPGSRYGFTLDDHPDVLPDPRSPRQPDGVHGLSQLHMLDQQRWSDHMWTGRQLAGASIYELHIGTFTAEGTLDSAINQLDHLVRLGVDIVELMPVNAFNGTHNWGYDGVLWYAVQETYGGPDGLQRFVDGAHARGLAVFLDVVYNHLGPSGNYLGRFGPYEAEAGKNTWGRTINLAGPDSEPVRRYIVDNALRWMSEFHIDGLRLDAVHALADDTATHLLEELATETEALSAHLGKPLSLVAESDLNDARLVTPRAAGGYGLDAQWDDDIHHAIHAAVSGERFGYYVDFGSIATLATTLRRTFYHAGTFSTFRGRVHGRPVDQLTTPASRFLAYSLTHDQVGNRAVGDRPSCYLSAGQLAVRAALVLCSPYTPMLFMGEEWGASTPFQFFTSHPEPELGRMTAEGRRAEFAHHGWDDADVPHPQDPETFRRSKLDWSEPQQNDHAWLLDVYTRLLALRKQRPELTDPRFDHFDVSYDEDDRWIMLHRGTVDVAVNLGPDPVSVELPTTADILLPAVPGVRHDGAELVLPGESFVVTARGGTVG